MRVIFERTTSDEGMYGIDEDMYEAIDNAELPIDTHGFRKGTFKITVTWSEDES